MHVRSALAAAAVFCSAAFVLAGTALGAEEARDFSGVWQAFASSPPLGRGGPGDLSAEGEIKVADFSARYPNLIEPGSYCVPAGMPATMASLDGYPIEITQTPDRITLVATMGSQYRRIFLDDRDIPANHPATGMGYSVGHWDGNTLAVETRLLSEMLTGRFPRTVDTVIVERISKITRGQVTAAAASNDSPTGFTANAIDDRVLAVALTITDPSLYRTPQTFTVYYQHLDDDALREYDCATDLWLQALDEANQ